MARSTTGGGKRVRVSQETINDIKRLGMTKALALAGKNKGAFQDGKVAEFAEGVRRMYGERRYQKAIDPNLGKAKPAAGKSPYGFQGMAGKAGKTGPGAKTVRKSTVSKPTANKPTAAQLASASARAGVKVTAMTPSRSKAKTASQVAAEKKAAAARAAAAKAAIKKAGGRTA